MRTVAFVALLVAVPLAGCLGTPASSSNASAPANVSSNASTPTADEVDTSSTPKGHVHDRWQGAERRTVVEATIPIQALRAEPGVAQDPLTAAKDCDEDEDAFPNPLCLGRAEFTPGDGRIVPPGTAKLVATVEWSGRTVTGVDLQFNPAFESGWRTLGLARSSGDRVSVEADRYNPEWDAFPLSWTDDGHSTDSRWRFAATAYAGDGFTAIAQGEVTVTIEAVRVDGSLPIEPPHPDWYADADAYHLASVQRNYTESWEQVQAWWFNRWNYMIWMEPANPVPPGTKEVVFEVNLTNDSPTAGTPVAAEADLYYWTNGSEPDTWPPGRVAESSRDGDQVTFRIAVPDRAADSLYSCGESMWGFLLYVHGPNAEDPVFPWDHPVAMHYEGRISIRGAATETTGDALRDLQPSTPDYVDGCETAGDTYA